jgi:flagellar hook protein FlgE
MSFALSSGVAGLQAHQQMLDVAGNNLANVNTTAFKASRILFSELLSETIKKASQPTTNTGGTNPVQMGSGVGVSSISPNMSQGNVVNTGNPLDMAIEGEGYFVLSDGQQIVYSRAGAFAVDQKSVLVDPATGYRVQRIGSEGETDNFQIKGDPNMHVPYDVAMKANATDVVKVAGNLSADATMPTIQTNVLSSGKPFTISNGTAATGDIAISALDQFTTGTFDTATITVTGSDHNGVALTDGTPLAITDTTTINELIAHINSVLGTSGSASLVNGKIQITDAESGYSQSDARMTFANTGTAKLNLPSYFEVSTVGGEEVKNVNITVYDSQGGQHVLSGAFVRTDTNNTWDMVLTSITGDVQELTPDNRRIKGIEFNAADGSYAGIVGVGGAPPDASQFVLTFANNPANSQTIGISMGAAGQLDGLTQFAGTSTAVAREQDGYGAGRLSTVSVNNEGILIGAFSNGVKKNIGTLQVALFQNNSGLENVGGNYFIPSANSGMAVPTQALNGGAGQIHGGSLEKSNADVATEFINLINAQNGFQANARTIRVATAILQELATLIR